MKQNRPAYSGHIFNRNGATETVQCLGANCPLCGIWQEHQEQKTKPKRKTPNLLDKPVVGFGARSFAHRFN